MKENKLAIRLIVILSVVVPGLVAIMLFSPRKLDLGDWVYVLPTVNAIINSATAVLLVVALWYVKKGNIDMHKKTMLACFSLGGLFLLSYVMYHSSVTSTVFGDTNGNGILDPDELAEVGGLRTFYVSVLLSHILLSAVVVPLILTSLYFALTDKVKQHRKLVKFAYPVWLYVSITGVIVYFLIQPYYPVH